MAAAVSTRVISGVFPIALLLNLLLIITSIIAKLVVRQHVVSLAAAHHQMVQKWRNA